MSTTVKTGWLKDKEGNKFAPKTLSSQIQTSDGILLEDKIKADLDAAKTEILENVTVPVDDALSSTSENPVQNKVLNSEFEEISIAMNVLEQSIDGKADKTHSHDDLYYTESEMDTALDGKANSEHTHILTDVSSTNAAWEYIDGSNLEDLLMSIDSGLNSLSSTIVDNKILYIVGNSTTAGAWTGSHEDITEYHDGLTVLYKINIAGVSGGTTLDINGLGAIPVHRNASTAVTTIYPVGSVLLLTYSGGAWLTADYDANTKNTAGTSNKADTKMYLVGAASQTSSGTTTYTNKNVYIDTDNCLYSNNEKVVTSSEIAGKADKNTVATYITPEMYGAKGDGSTDDSAAIQAAIDAAGSSNVVYLARKTYKISTGIQLTHSNRRFKCDGTILYDGMDVAVLIGSHHVIVDIDTVTATNGTALKLSATDKYVEYCTVNVGQITASKIGLHMYVSGYALVYNQIRIGEINATDTGVLVWADSGVANENWYYLGRIGGCTTGIKIHSDESLDINSGIGANTNRFFSGSFEHLKDDAHAIVLERTIANTFQDIRCEEYYGAKSIVMSGLCSRNEIGLSRIITDEIDFSGLEHGSVANVLYASMIWHSLTNWLELGQHARIDWNYGLGFTYNPYMRNFAVSATDFDDYHIKQIANLIPTTVLVDDASLNGVTMQLSTIYSNMRSMARGFPVTFTFGEANGKILLTDVFEKTILDNSDGKYSGKTVVVRWVGTNDDSTNPFEYSNNWDVQILGESYITDSELASKGYATHQDISGKVDKTDSLTLTGVDADGNTHTWTVYGKGVS